MGLTSKNASELFEDDTNWHVVADAWKKHFSIPVETTLKAVLDYYHKKFCVDSAGEVDGE